MENYVSVYVSEEVAVNEALSLLDMFTANSSCKHQRWEGEDDAYSVSHYTLRCVTIIMIYHVWDRAVITGSICTQLFSTQHIMLSLHCMSVAVQILDKENIVASAVFSSFFCPSMIAQSIIYIFDGFISGFFT